MLTVLAQLDLIVKDAIREAFAIDSPPGSPALVGVSQNEKFGDYQSNAAMGLVKPIAEKTGHTRKPREIAELIKSKLQLGEIATEVTIAGPGFLNIRLSPAWLARRLEATAPDTRIGVEAAPNPQTIVVDYSGPNIA